MNEGKNKFYSYIPAGIVVSAYIVYVITDFIGIIKSFPHYNDSIMIPTWLDWACMNYPIPIGAVLLLATIVLFVMKKMTNGLLLLSIVLEVIFTSMFFFAER